MGIEAVELDDGQRRAAARLARLVDRKGRPRTRERGVYLYGRPGRGKTMLMDAFLGTVAPDRARRWHFHRFFAELHAAVRATRSVDAAVRGLLGGAELVCFDEFHADDIGDAMLIARALDTLFARRVVLVLTSNQPPEGLLPNPLFHDRFVPTIERIRAALDLVTVDGSVDYRVGRVRGERRGFAAGRYLIDKRGLVRREVDLRGAEGLPGGVTVRVGDRAIEALRVEGDSIVVDFTALCGAPTSAADYLELTRRFRRWTVTGVPPLRTVPEDRVARLLNLLDVLYDADIELILCAEVGLAELTRDVGAVPGIARAESRLHEIAQRVATSVW